MIKQVEIAQATSGVVEMYNVNDVYKDQDGSWTVSKIFHPKHLVYKTVFGGKNEMHSSQAYKVQILTLKKI